VWSQGSDRHGEIVREYDFAELFAKSFGGMRGLLYNRMQITEQ